jgi:hypothetical protein
MLTIAFATAPMVLDQCAASCDVASATDTATPAPACHHATSPTVHIGQAPRGCGHDHRSIVAALTTSAAPIAPTLASLVAVVTSQSLAEIAAANRFAAPSASPPRDLLPQHLSVSLRI